MKLKKLWNVSNKSTVILSSFLLASFLIGLVVFIGSTSDVAAVETTCTGGGCTTTTPVTTTTVTTVPECCDGDQEEKDCGSGICEGTKTRTCVGGSWGSWSDCSTKDMECSRSTYCDDASSCNGHADYAICDADGYCGKEIYTDDTDDSECAQQICDECDKGPDCVIDIFSYTIDVWKSGAWYCDDKGSCNDECVYDHFCLDNDYKDGGPYTFGCGAQCDGYGAECLNYCAEPEIRYIGYCDLWPGDCTCKYDTEDCDEYDDWYCYGDIRKYEDWYCTPGECLFEITGEEDCNDYDCSTGLYCVGMGTDTIQEMGDDYTCDKGDCTAPKDKLCNGPWVCEGQCNYQDCGPVEDTMYICYKSNGNGFKWDTSAESKETNCQDGYDNDCDGLIDCKDPDCHLPPITTKEYGTPFYSNEAEWITSDTLITLTATDEDICPDEEFTSYWRNTLVDKRYCSGEWDCSEATGSGSFITYEEPFTKGEESCHLIEYYSIDEFNPPHEELPHKKQCVFVDNTGPEPVKTVGDPRTKWDGKDAYFYDIADKCWNTSSPEYMECWKVTLLTEIKMDCDDKPEEHPVGVDELCYKVDLDGSDVTNDYCNNYHGQLTTNDNGGGEWCCVEAPYTLYFKEETYHELEYYCVDKLGNEGDIDIEKFKVEGTNFEIQLNKKWNLISVPFVLLSDNPDEIFKDIKDNLDSVWTYDPDHLVCDSTDPNGWCVYTSNGDPDTLKHIIPGWGYWVMMKDGDVLLIGGSLFQPKVTPPTRKMIPGWNLIGYYGTEGETGYYGPVGNGKEAYCALYSLVNTNSGLTEWSSLVTYWQLDLEPWKYLNECNKMDPGAGYWIEMDVTDGYAPATACPAYC